MASEASEYLSVAQAATLLGVSRVSVWRWIRDGRLPAARLGSRTTRLRRHDLEQFLTLAQPTGTLDTATRSNGHDAPPRPAEPTRWAELRPDTHVVQFYESEAYLLERLAEYMDDGLRAGDAAVVIATTAQRGGLIERLRAAGHDIAAARAAGRYVDADAFETLARFMVDGQPDAALFQQVVEGIISQATAPRRGLRLFGSMVALLVADGNYDATVRLERLWNDLRLTRPFALFCGYPLTHGGEALTALYNHVNDAHEHVLPAESYSALPTAEGRLRAIAELQQKARWLEAEVAERRAAEQQLAAALEGERAARAELEAALQLRDEFLSVAAHELRTPLTGLAGRVQLLQRRLNRDGALQPEQVAPALDAIVSQSDKLAQLLNRLLDTTRLEAGKLTLERQPTDLATLVGQMVAAAQAATEGHTFALAAPATLPAEVDPLRLEQVLTNLLDNALKYSPDGGVISVTLAESDDGAVEFAVRDHGPGIAPERRAYIFERFYQAHERERKAGLGLGLYVSRQIVELHGGTLEAEFPPDGGACFRARLPRAAGEAAQQDRAAD